MSHHALLVIGIWMTFSYLIILLCYNESVWWKGGNSYGTCGNSTILMIL